jgi:hypothetical protein
MFLQSTGKLPPDCMASHPRRLLFSGIWWFYVKMGCRRLACGYVNTLRTGDILVCIWILKRGGPVTY